MSSAALRCSVLLFLGRRPFGSSFHLRRSSRCSLACRRLGRTSCLRRPRLRFRCGCSGWYCKVRGEGLEWEREATEEGKLLRVWRLGFRGKNL